MIVTRKDRKLVWCCARCNADATNLCATVRDVEAATPRPYPGRKRPAFYGSAAFVQPKAEWRAACDVHLPERRQLIATIPTSHLETHRMVVAKGRTMTKYGWFHYTNWLEVVRAAKEAADA